MKQFEAKRKRERRIAEDIGPGSTSLQDKNKVELKSSCSTCCYDKCEECRYSTSSYCQYHQSLMVRMSKYDLTAEEVIGFITGASCNSCGKELTSEEVCIDHCHKTDIIRGVLCSGCNIALGHLEDDIDKIQKLHNYMLDSMTAVSAEEYEYPGIYEQIDE